MKHYRSLFFVALALQASGFAQTPQPAAPAAPAPAAAAATAPKPPYELKNKSVFTLTEGVRIPFVPIGWVKPQAGVVATQEVAVDPNSFRVTSILLGNPSLAVINGRSYEEGQFLRVPRGSTVRAKVYRITDGKVLLQIDDKLYTAPLRRPELGERRPEEPLLSEERDVVPEAPKPRVSVPPVPAPAPQP